ncbi:protein translocase subunit SecF [Candidatus Absconditicoccus praedator]|uniref:protein translocase subunit SecF n=1 Tax=Candidatus Absconditicoccus praedator TaxID=2735562 RepID=UPI001E5E7289|nr:protein translocase subunit SecF [Candidatus Absconditicoccus praedator]UFX82802.1 protein translocase subunit SecF [Candidatus Absconditicoccus praedator]
MEPKFDIIKRSFLWIGIALVLAILAVLSFVGNLRLSIQFTGGMEMIFDGQVEDESHLTQDLNEYLIEEGYDDPNVIMGESEGFPSLLIESRVDDPDKVDGLSAIVRGYLLDNGYISTEEDIMEVVIIGPSIGDWMKRSAIIAIAVGLVLVSIYMLFAFSGIRHYLSPGILALITILTLFFDVLLPAGAYGVLMFFNPAIQVDLIFVVAILTIIGYSINDTVIIFDRIRENFKLDMNKIEEGKITYEGVFEKSVWQTMRRSLATSFSTLLVLVSMYIFGGGIIELFAFTLMIGVIAGTFSSIFLAAPLAYKFAIDNSQKYSTEG